MNNSGVRDRGQSVKERVFFFDLQVQKETDFFPMRAFSKF